MNHYTRNDCEQLDQQDPLAAMRDAFAIPEGMIYLDGNSLGVRPKAAKERALQVIEQEWGTDLIKSWNTAGWFELPYKLGDKVAQIIGADAGEVVVTDSTGINLYKVLAAALTLTERKVIVMNGSNFPTDNYMAQGLLQQLGSDYEIRFAEHDNIMQAIDEDVAVVCLTHVHYKTGEVFDMAAVTAKAEQCGAISIWDLCHSAGAMDVQLNACNADFAVGCTYKYLNGGPGSPGFIFAAKRHHGKALQPLTGWWGHAAPFAFERDYRPAENIGQMLSGTQPILSLAVTEVGLDIFLQVDIKQIREKSQKLTQLFIDLMEQRCGQYGFTLVSPRDASIRGSQVSFNHEHGYPVMQAMISRDVVGDFRAPKNVRFGFTPLYISYVDVWDAVDRIVDIMETNLWQQPEFNQRGAVT
ncbi:kynureninase [Dasania sp. GY-MA-18]|uniref:Kynureninase n=1 Tax=Dasania phycosphaerae TaxID=2950436 RepID=A0A9J6RLF1_9GAMM|nr:MULTISPECIES: kynureninase [Dasania]MCR8922821.1 kynureninase [Dasania sp. GY-MA-18]MCZ0865252.1 kynureninase [Dasania phycosphaerae]MCZ0868977.1 kynureninase [Dasania phycosphaerae]